MKKANLVILGAIIFAISEIMWHIISYSSPYKWILEPTPGILLCAFLILASCMVCSYKYHTDVKSPFSFLIGLWLSITVMIIFVGPGNLWPIALAIDYIMVTPIVYMGWFIGSKIAGKKFKTT